MVSLTTPIFFTSRNIGNVFSQTSVIAVLALGQLLVIVTRGIDLSVGSTVALSGVTGAVVFQHTQSSVLVIAAILGTGVAVGLVNGLVYVYGRVPHPFIVTLATLSIVRGLALWASDGTLIPNMPPIVQTLGGGSIDWLPYSIFVVAGLALCYAGADDMARVGPLAVRGRRQPRGGAPLEHPDAQGARHGLRPQRARGRRRRPAHRGADRRRLAHRRRSRRAGLDRGRDHRRRGVRGRPRQRRQRARRARSRSA